MRLVRNSTFETNSSSAHSLTLKYNYSLMYPKPKKDLVVKLKDYGEILAETLEEKLSYLATWIHDSFEEFEWIGDLELTGDELKNEIDNRIKLVYDHPKFQLLIRLVKEQLGEDYNVILTADYDEHNYIGFSDESRDGGLIYSLFESESLLKAMLFNDNNTLYYGSNY